MVCSAKGFPAPTYRWFKSVSEDTLAEFDKKQINFSEDDNTAVLQVTATPMTFGKTYKCLATNSLGEAEKYFTLLKIQVPKKPDAVRNLKLRVHCHPNKKNLIRQAIQSIALSAPNFLIRRNKNT